MDKSNINVFLPYFRVDEVLAEIKKCLEVGWVGSGFKTLEFEEAWKQYTGIKHAHFINSATSGLHLAIRLLKEKYGWSNNDEIISTPFTFVSTNHVILYEKLKPVFADIDEFLCLDPKSVEEKISDKTRAIIFVGIGGNSGKLGEIVNICKDRNLKLILDAAHMAGTRINGKHVGNESDVTVFSFQATKNLPTADSGMICFKDGSLDKEVRSWSWMGIDKDTFSRTSKPGIYQWEYDVIHEGFKYQGNSVIAAMGLISLKYLDDDNSYRRQLALWYDNLLNDSNIKTITVAPNCESSRYLYQIMVKNRNKVVLSLNKENIYPGVHYRNNLCYGMYKGNCPNAQKVSERIISLPMYIGLKYKDVVRITETLISILNN